MEPLAPLMANAAPDVYWLRLFSNPGTLVMMIPITAILVGGIMGLAKLIIRHRERMAMIERGMDPDHPADQEK